MATAGTPQGKCFRSSRRPLLLLLAVVLFLGAGCAAPGDFDTVSSKLDRGGDLFLISRMPLDRQLFSRLELKQQQDLEKQLIACNFDMALEALGVRQIKLCGASSLQVPESFPQISRNKFFAMIDRQAPGLINELFPAENQEFPDFYQLFPGEAHGAFCANIRVQPLINALEKSGGKLKQLLLLIPFDMNKETLDSISGWYYGAVYSQPGSTSADPLFFMLSLPDTRSTFSRILTVMAKNTPALVEHKNGRTTLFSSKAARSFFTRAARRGTTFDKLWLTLEKSLPESGYLRYRTRKAEIVFENMRFDLENCAATLNREPEGVLFTENSTKPAMQQFAELLSRFYNSLPINQVKPKPQSKPKVSAANITAEQQLKVCRNEHLSDIFSGLKRYALQHRNRFPETGGLAGLQSLLDGKFILPPALRCPGKPQQQRGKVNADSKLSWKNCSYIYFGGFNYVSSGSRIPVVIDRPGNHVESFNVLYNDGTSVTVKLKRADSCRRMISYLYTQDKYDEKVFRELMRQAAAFDRKMKME